MCEDVSASADEAFIFEHVNFSIGSISFPRASLYYINALSCEQYQPALGVSLMFTV